MDSGRVQSVGKWLCCVSGRHGGRPNALLACVAMWWRRSDCDDEETSIKKVWSPGGEEAIDRPYPIIICGEVSLVSSYSGRWTSPQEVEVKRGQPALLKKKKKFKNFSKSTRGPCVMGEGSFIACVDCHLSRAWNFGRLSAACAHASPELHTKVQRAYLKRCPASTPLYVRLQGNHVQASYLLCEAC